MKRRRPVLLSFAGALVGAALAAGVAWATIQDGSGVIQGCYNNGGNLKIVSELPCPGGYTPLQWNQQGAKGEKGDKGDKGDPGPAGTGGVSTPVGAVVPYAGSTAPTGWLLADGSAVGRTAHPALFAAVGTTYGAGDGSTTFNLPDLRGRVAVAMGSNAAVASLGQSENLAEDARSPEHTHPVPAHYHGPGTLTVAPAGNHGHLVGTVQKRVCGTGCSVAAELNISVPNNYSANDIFDPSYSTSAAGAHSHGLSGTVGNSSSGVDGDQSMTSGTAGPSYITLNYIIRAT